MISKILLKKQHKHCLNIIYGLYVVVDKNCQQRLQRDN